MHQPLQPLAAIDTPRLTLVPATSDLLRADLSSPAELAALLGAQPPRDWPPSGGEYDEGAMRYMLGGLETGGEAAAGWYGWYVLLRPPAPAPALGELVASAGFFGPPGSDLVVEIGYSVGVPWRGRGIATEAVRALTRRLVGHPRVRAVRARTRADNAASAAVLERCRFDLTSESDGERLYVMSWSG